MSTATPPALSILLQTLPQASPVSTKLRASFYALAIGDALGAPCEFLRRGTFPHTTTYIPNTLFRTPPGIFTDDTTMALCLAQAIILTHSSLRNRPLDIPTYTPAGGVTLRELPGESLQFITLQAMLFIQWFMNAHYTPMDRCFDIGNQTTTALGMWITGFQGGILERRIPLSLPSAPKPPGLRFTNQNSRIAIGGGNARPPPTIRGPVDAIPAYDIETARRAVIAIDRTLNRPVSRGNGSLMRILPVALACYEQPWETLMMLTHLACLPTHPDIMCIQASQIYVAVIKLILNHATTTTNNNNTTAPLTKLDLMHFLTVTYPAEISPSPLVGNLAALFSPAITRAEVEALRAADGRQEVEPGLLQLMNTHPLMDRDPPSTGYVLDTLRAVLSTFFTTATFEEGVVKCVNYGDDADTVAAIFGGLAGVWYAEGVEGVDGWFSNMQGRTVRSWWDGLVLREWVGEAVERLVAMGGWGLGGGGDGEREGETEGEEEDTAERGDVGHLGG